MRESTASHEHAGRRAARNYALIFLLVAAGIGAVGYAHFRTFSGQYRATVDRDLTMLGEEKVRELVRWRRERLSDAAILYDNAAIADLVRRFLERPTDVDARHQLETLFGNYQRDVNYGVVRLLDASGVTRLSEPHGLPPISSAVAQRLPEIMRAGQVTFLDFHRNENDHRVYIDVLVPVLDQRRPGSPLGLLYLRIDPTLEFYPDFARWPIATVTGQSKLVRRDGNAALYLTEPKTRADALLNERVPLTDTARTAVMAVLGRQGIVHGVDQPGSPVVGYVRAVPDSPWFVVLQEEEAEAYAPVREQLWLTIGLVTALVVGLAVGFLALWRGERVRSYRTREKDAEVLRRSEERYQRLFESNPYPKWVYDLETLAFLDVNPAAIRNYGYSRDEFLAMTIRDIYPAEDLARLAAELAPQRNSPDDTGIWRHRKKDGTVIDVEVTTHTMVHDGRPAVLVIPLDITERKRATDALHEYVLKVSEAQRLGHVGSWFWEGTGPIHWSDEMYRIYGVSPDSFTPTVEALVGLIHPEDRSAMGAWMAACAAGNQPADLDLRIFWSDGSIRYVKGRGDAVFDAAGGFVHVAGTVQDITAFKRMEEERERLVASLQQALAEVKTLSGLLPICSYCKKVRDDDNFWHNVDGYMAAHSDLTFSHSMCPDCMRKHFPEYADEVLKGR